MTNEKQDGLQWTRQGEAQQQPQRNTSALSTGLAELFSSTSMTADSRSLKEVTEVHARLTEYYKDFTNSTTSEVQRRTIPHVENLTTAISPHLPGLAMYIIQSGVMYVGAALFSSENLTPIYENVSINNNGMHHQMSVERTPSQYAETALINRLRDHYLQVGKANNANVVRIISVSVVDLNMLEHDQAPDDKPRAIAHSIAQTWEEAVMVKLVEEVAEATGTIPSVWKNPKSPYGNQGTAEVRVGAVSGRVNRDHTLSPANMEVVTTVSGNRNQGIAEAVQEICRTTATVELMGVNFNAYQEHIVASGGNQGMQPGIYPMGYRPLMPVITINEVQSGEMLNFHSGLPALFFGLYTLMTTNNQFIFCEALRRSTVGSRGNLADLEPRIRTMISAIPGAGAVQRIELNEKNISDTDLVNNWIVQNVSQRATFQVNLLTGLSNNSVTNFLLGLASNKNGDKVKTVIAILNSMTNGKFVEIIEKNRVSGKGWSVGHSILIPTPTLEVNGIANHNGKNFNTLELGEMMICHLKGGKGSEQAIDSFLNTKYGSSNDEDVRARSQRLRIELAQSLFDNHVHINGFAQPHVWNPSFMAALGEAFSVVGNLNVANSMLSIRNNQASYSLGAGLATQAHAGSSGFGSVGPAGVNHAATFM